jgi:predicted deacylase
MTRVIEIGSALSAGPGRVDGFLKTAELPDGKPIEIPVTIIQGAKDGPVLWLHGCVHGNEYCGAYTIHEFVRGLNPGLLKGAVVALPFLNITASQRFQRMSPYEQYNIGDLNRCFPGRADGSLTEQIGHAIWTELKRYATHLVDIHTALTPDTRWALFADCGGEVSKVGLAMAEAFGYQHTLPTPPTNLKGSAMMTAGATGIPSFIIEAGGIGPAFSMDTVRDCAARLENVCRRIGMIDQPVKKFGKLTLFSNFHWCNAPTGGLFRPAVKCGQPIKKGDLVGTYFDLHGDVLDEMRAPASGIVLAIHPGPLMPQGDTLVHIGLDPRPQA